MPSRQPHGIMFAIAALSVIAAGSTATGIEAADAGASGDAGTTVSLVDGRTTTVILQPDPRRPVETQPMFRSRVPSYFRGIELDGEQRWIEAAAAYQEALVEVGRATSWDGGPLWDRAAFKVDLERRRSHALAHIGSAALVPSVPTRGARMERARLLRLKMMSVRAATGAVSPALLGETISGLRAAAGAESDGIEVRLLLCATRAVAGDRTAARWELAHVSPGDRAQPTHALPLAVCQAALGDQANALASLAVGVYRLGPSSRFLPGQTRELEIANDWDVIRRDPRFDLLFR